MLVLVSLLVEIVATVPVLVLIRVVTVAAMMAMRMVAVLGMELGVGVVLGL